MSEAQIAVQTRSVVLDGLSDSQVQESRDKHGLNVFTQHERKSFFSQYLDSFGDPIIKILLAALALNIIFMFSQHNWFETIGIAVAVFLATFVSTLSEYGSESAFIKLQQEASKMQCRVKRQNGLQQLPITEIVVGDIVLLQAGERVPADGILISGDLKVDQSAINGESAEVSKKPLNSTDTRWSPEIKNQLFRGTVICSGEGVMQVRNVGDKTLYGSLASELQDESAESPMKARLAILASFISKLGYTAAVLVAFADLFNAIVIDNGYAVSVILSELQNFQTMIGNIFHAALLAISVVVVAVPEGLPMMITVVLSANMVKMQKDHVMVRRLVGIETAGSLNILFTDKTGTLTTGNLAVDKIIIGDGTGFHSSELMNKNTKLSELVAISCVYNSSASVSNGKAIGGNSTERALLTYATPMVNQVMGYKTLKGEPFDSSKKYSWSRISGRGQLVLVKGAPEKLLPRCQSYLDKNGEVCKRAPSNMVYAKMTEMTKKAMRVLALAIADSDYTNPEVANLTLVALVGIRDGLRPQVKKAVQTVHSAGIQTVMITGDNKETAAAIATDSGVLSGLENEVILTGTELAAIDDNTLKKIIPSLRVVARALPSDKSRLVRLSQDLGLVVGMTGDGINDAPALKKADVGFAMGSGTEVAKEAGDIVILDNNFASISKAILYGRTIFKSIQKFIVFQLTMNLCAVGVSLIGPFIGIDTPVTVMQMLWINIIMDTLAGLAFAGEPPLKEYMLERPKSRAEPIINRQMITEILVTGGYTVMMCSAFLKMQVFRDAFHFTDSFVYFMTAFFTLFIFSGIFNAFNARTHRINLTAHLHKNKSFILIMGVVSIIQLLLIYFGGPLFRTQPMSLPELANILLLAVTVIPFDIIRKIAFKFKNQ